MPKKEKPAGKKVTVKPAAKKLSKKKNKGGRPTKYQQSYEEAVFKLCLLGAIDEKIADFFNVDLATINNWKISHPKFFESIKAGREEADAKVADSLYNRAMGYTHKDVDIKMYKGEIIKTEIIRHYPPDPTSAIFWLKNRQKAAWRDKHEVEHSGAVDLIEITNYGTENEDK